MKIRLNPIPSEHNLLVPIFYKESERLFRTATRLGGIIYLSSVILFAILVSEPYMQVPETIILDIINTIAAVGFIIVSYIPLSQRLQYTILMACIIMILLTNARESILLQNFMSIFLMCLAIELFGVTVPWPSIWTVGVQASCIVSSLTMFFYWNPALFGPLISIILLGIFSIFIHILFTRQRWESFFNHYQIQKLNIELQRVNEQLQTHTDRLESELALARHIQQGLLPPPIPDWTYLDVICYSKPAFEVGGDFYSYHAFAHQHVALAVGDVSGKGVAAALLMATSLSLFTSSFNYDLSPSWRLMQLDTAFAPYTRTRRQNCAMCYVELHHETMHIANAGCIPPYIRRTNGTIDWPDVSGFALGYGLGSQLGYQEVCLPLLSGDMVVLISDGVVELMDETGEIFGFDRLRDVIEKGPFTNAQAMLEHILSELTHFSGTTPPHDDMTMIVFQA